MIIIIVKCLFLKKNCKYYGVDVNHFEFFDEDYENYGYDDYYQCVYDDNDFYDDNYYDDYLYYKKPFNKFERLVFVENNIVDLINNDDNDKKLLLSVKEITLLIDKINILIYEKRILT